MTGFDNPAATGGLALLVSLGIQWLKNSPWATWFTRESDKANLGLSIVLAGVATLGIHWNYVDATDTIAIVGVKAALSHNLWQWVLQWATQHAAYKGIVVPSETLGEIRGLLQRAIDGGPISAGDAKVKKDA